MSFHFSPEFLVRSARVSLDRSEAGLAPMDLLLQVSDQGLRYLWPLIDVAPQDVEYLLSDMKKPSITAEESQYWQQLINSWSLGDITRLPICLDLQGSCFQKRVWQALIQIERGSLVSYSDLAKAAGYPNAVRAVATACGNNPIALLLPCHRVVRKDGGLGGYRWGLEMKRFLLKKEGAV